MTTGTSGSFGAAHLTGLSTALADRYRLTREVGAGGTATVWLAEDVRHGRRVAIKVLHPELSAVLGPERFLAEIRTTANLQHPHILPLFDSGSAGGLLYYVMPYVEGETLRARLERERQLPIADGLRLATEIADALHHAHARGVVHRDVKPENILLQGGHALVADFGIALAVQQAGGQRMTQTGLSLGTPQYMAPEQAMGERGVDARADVYALGAVLYEMLAGEPPFTGPNTQAILARVLTETPRALTAQRPTVPPHVDDAVRRALQGLPADRFESAAAFSAALTTTHAPLADLRPAQAAPGFRAPARGSALLVAGAVLAAVALGWGLGRATGEPSPRRAPVRFTIERDSSIAAFRDPALSPDGGSFVYVGEGPEGSQLYLRRREDAESVALPGTEGAIGPCFSPDGRSVAFVANGALRRMRLAGGEPIAVVAQLPQGAASGGVAWGGGDTLFVSAGRLYRVPAAGGRLEPVRVADPSATLVGPTVLPGGRALVVTVYTAFNTGSIGLLDLASGHLRTLGPGRGARHAAGHLVYVGGTGELLARPFDVRRLDFAGEPRSFARGLVAMINTANFGFAVSPSGDVVYGVAGRLDSSVARRLTLTNAAGRAERTLALRMPWSPRFSPDGRRLAFGAYAPGRDSSDIWVADLVAGTVARLTTVGLDANEPVWSPDGRQLAFDQLAPGGKDLYVQPVDGGPGRLLARRPGTQWTTDWTPDGTAVLFTEATEATGLDVWVQPLDGGAARPYLTSTANELGARVSPDGRWIAYQSDESGRWEVYVEAFATPGAKTPVSAGGGAFPAWGRDGRTLYFWQDDALVAARLETGGTGGPRVVERTRRPLQVPYVGNILSMYDVAPDGRRLALVSGEERARRLVVALDALGDLRGASSAR